MNAFKLAHHIVRSEPAARVLTLNLELCTLHFQETKQIEKILSFLLWGDGCAASLITAEPEGLAIESFRSLLVPDSQDTITWQRFVLDVGVNEIFTNTVALLVSCLVVGVTFSNSPAVTNNPRSCVPNMSGSFPALRKGAAGPTRQPPETKRSRPIRRLPRHALKTARTIVRGPPLWS